MSRGARKVYATARETYSDPRPAVQTHVVDVRSAESVAALAAAVSDVDLVINNAGILLPATLLTGEFDDIADTFDVNAYGPLRVARAFAPILAKNGGGDLVNVLSVLSWLSGSGAYGASKAAAWSVTNSLRGELATQNTRVLGVHAGFIDTEMVGLPVSVFRSGMILAHRSYAGQLNVPDMFTRLIFSVLATGLAPTSFYPRDADGHRQRSHYDGLPVDFVDWLIEAGHPVHRIDDYAEWLRRFESALKALSEQQRQQSVLPLIHAYGRPEAPVQGSLAPAEEFKARGPSREDRRRAGHPTLVTPADSAVPRAGS